MVTTSDWWAGLIDYNTTLFPLQPIVMVLALVLTMLLLFKPCEASSTAMKIFLAFSMLLNGIVFFIVLGTYLPSPLRYFQAALFIAIGVLLGIDIFTKWSILQIPPKGIKRNLTYLFLLMTAFYPIWGLLRGHNLMQLIYPGMLPCGSTAFALVILAGSLPKVNKAPYILLLIWAIPFAPFIQIPLFGVYEDSIMFAVGLYSLTMLILTLLKKEDKGLIQKNV